MPKRRSRAGSASSVGCKAKLALMALVLGGCPQTPTSKTPKADQVANDKAAEPQTTVILIPGAGEGPRDDPAADGWDSEAFSKAAQRQLDKIATLLGEPACIDADAVAQMLWGDFACTPLRPSETAQVYKDKAVTVRRASGPADAPMTHRGPAGFAAALDDLAGPFENGTGCRIEFKIFSVDLQSEPPVTRQHVAISSRGPQGTVEEHATWQCTWEQSGPRLRSIKLLDYEQSRVRGAGKSLFSDCTEAALAHNDSFKTHLMHGANYWLTRIETAQGIKADDLSGLAVGDVNGDGLDDLYRCQNGGLPNRLLIQNEDGTFTDRSEWSGVDWQDRTLCALLVDMDNDGTVDLVLGTARVLLVMKNDASGRFEKVAQFRTVPPVYHLSAADYDHDGDLDLYACRYTSNSYELAYPFPCHDANNGGTNFLLRNEGKFKFSEVTRPSGLDTDNQRWSYAASWEDYDNDGDLDLYVANDYGRNCLYRNEGGRFANVAAKAGLEDQAPSMSISWADVNRDGHMDVYVGNTWSPAGNRVAFQQQFQPQASDSTRAQFQRLAGGNGLYLNDGEGTFREVGLEAAVNVGGKAFSSLFIDLNNDGWEDLLVANGFITARNPNDLSSYFWRQVVSRCPDQAANSTAADEYKQAFRQLTRLRRRGRSLSGHERHRVFLNTAARRFADISAISGLDFIDDGRGAALVDWDFDGDLDLWIANRTAPQLRFLRNDTPTDNHFLAMRLEGKSSNPDGIGARVEVHLRESGNAPSNKLIKTLHAGGGLRAQSSKWLHFGLGGDPQIEQLVVRWPGGDAETFGGLAPDAFYRIVQGSGQATRWEPPVRKPLAASVPSGGALADTRRVFLTVRVPVPSFDYTDFSGVRIPLNNITGATLLNLWASWSAPSLDELQEWSKSSIELHGTGLRIIALSADGVEESESSLKDARKAVEKLYLPFERGMASAELVSKMQLLHNFLFRREMPQVVPMSYLIDRNGNLAAIYRGRVEMRQLIEDVNELHESVTVRQKRSAQFAGRWLTPPGELGLADLAELAGHFEQNSFFEEALRYGQRALTIHPGSAALHMRQAMRLQQQGKASQALNRFEEAARLEPDSFEANYALGKALSKQGSFRQAVRHMQKAVQLNPRSAIVRTEFGFTLYRLGKPKPAVVQLRRALEMDPNLTTAHNNLGVIHLSMNQPRKAANHLSQAVKLDPQHAHAHFNLSVALGRMGQRDQALEIAQIALALAEEQAYSQLTTQIRDHQTNLEKGR